jgi:hypothetical protein
MADETTSQAKPKRRGRPPKSDTSAVGNPSFWRLNLLLPPWARQRIEKKATIMGMSCSEVGRLAICLYLDLEVRIGRGTKIFVKDGDDLRELVVYGLHELQQHNDSE